jgi:hypothetical protein
MADYAIASQAELRRAIDQHCQKFFLEGPSGFDWILPNELIALRENPLYVDFIEVDGDLFWSSPVDQGVRAIPKSIRLVAALTRSGIVSTVGLQELMNAWSGFDPEEDTHCSEWQRRSRVALDVLASKQAVADDFDAAARLVVDLWPMPMVELVINQPEMRIEAMKAKRDALTEAWMADELGLDSGE